MSVRNSWPAGPAGVDQRQCRADRHLPRDQHHRRQWEIIATSAPGLPRPNVASHPAFRVHAGRDTGRLYISPPFQSRIAGRPLIWLSRRLNNPDGSFAGVIAINFPPEQFVAFFRDARVRPQDMMAVIGLDGVVRSTLHNGATTSGGNVGGTSVMANQTREPNGTFLTPGIRDGRVRFFSHRRLRDFPLFVTYGVLEADVLAVPRHRAKSSMSAPGW